MALLATAALSSAVLLSASPAWAQALAGSDQGASTAVARGTGTPVDSIVAIVDNGVITERQLDTRVSMVMKRLQSRGGQVPPQTELQKQVLNQMVVAEIQKQRADLEGVRISDKQVDDTLENLAKSNGMSLAQFQSNLQAQGVAWDSFREDARDELTLAELRRRDVDSKVTVSDAEVANYLASQHGLTSAPKDLHLQHLLVAVPQGASSDQIQAAEKRAEGFVQEAAGGRDFERLVKSNSDAGDAKKGGDMGFKPQSELPKSYIDAVSTIAPGQVAHDPIRTAEGWEVVRLVERRTSTDAANRITQTHVSHILLRVGEGSDESDAVRKLLTIKANIEAGKGTFAEYARTTSQDGSAGQGGDLGWINPGQTVPEFERAMNQLQPGQISNPVRTEFGYHLIMVQGRREVAASAQAQEDAARQAIGQRKSEQAYADWMRELYDAAYVKTMLNPQAAP
jgi:peptidyl-prolyl cis-trans isomerase SurA